MPAFACERVASGLAMLGVFIVDNQMPVGKAIEELLIAAHCLSDKINGQNQRDLVPFCGSGS
jgi:hypothetical protein